MPSGQRVVAGSTNSKCGTLQANTKIEAAAAISSQRIARRSSDPNIDRRYRRSEPSDPRTMFNCGQVNGRFYNGLVVVIR
jgi:hypothetical protein